ncbi:MAG: hypothetical protein LBL91_03105 [Lachnospiraceae bacterium]|jgi:hypothetical protein|nr:hypothetical protein [Lachnospiraceae bacterium]
MGRILSGNVIYQNSAYGIEIQVDDEFIWLGSDYIGASVAWAESLGKYERKEIVEFLEISRRLGGHIVFPRSYYKKDKNNILQKETYRWRNISINQARGGRRGYYDRFDLILYAIKMWYEDKNNEKSSKLYKTINKNKEWFDLFGNFREYINFFKLNGFVNDNYEVLDLTTYNGDETNGYKIIDHEDDSEEILCRLRGKDNYRRYVKGVNNIIEQRKM